MPGLQERERARRRDSAHAGGCGTGNQQLARRPAWAAAGEGVVNGYDVSVNSSLKRLQDRITELERKVLELERSANGSNWSSYVITAKGRELLEQSKK